LPGSPFSLKCEPARKKRCSCIKWRPVLTGYVCVSSTGSWQGVHFVIIGCDDNVGNFLLPWLT
jgi:hypothetical protein